MTKDEALFLSLKEINRLCDTGKITGETIETIQAIKAALEAKDEPMEFFDWYDNAHWGNEDFKEGCHRAWNAAIKYTTPPQRKPLTDEEIERLWPMRPTDDVINFARAIEAAHGIKG